MMKESSSLEDFHKIVIACPFVNGIVESVAYLFSRLSIRISLCNRSLIFSCSQGLYSS